MDKTSVLKVALIGNPNSGKTTIFNGLTGANQKVGNWPGVTVDKKVGYFKLQTGTEVEIVDLPGIYSIEQDEFSLDEKIAKNYLAHSKVDLIINLVDATSLDRQLLLTHQLRELKTPILVVVNMMDVAENNGLTVKIEEIARLSGLPVIGISGTQSSGIQTLKQNMRYVYRCKKELTPLPKQRDNRLIARLRETQIWAHDSSTYRIGGETLTERIDKIVLHPYLGLPIFLLSMYLLFTFAINFGAIFIDFFDILIGAWMIDGVATILATVNAPDWVTVILADGLGSGIKLVGTFIPVIGFLYLGLSLMESSGYIVRAAFVVDRLMHVIGLPGKAFVPLIVGFGCNVPSIMATRTMTNEADRMVTVAMTPFMSCGARLTVYALFAAAFFPNYGQNIVFALYLFGIVMAVFTGWIFRKAFYQSHLSLSIMEMPNYYVPSIRNILYVTWHRLSSFISRAGKTIIGVIVVLTFVNSWGTDGSFGNENSERSVLSVISKQITPILAPIGIESDNWAATVGVITGIFAKEAVVATLDALYAGTPDDNLQTEKLSLLESTELAFKSIPANLSNLTEALTDPLGIRISQFSNTQSAAEEQNVSAGTLKSMATLFGSAFAAFCYLVFILLYTPCVAVMGTLVREVGHRWSWIVISWSTVLAYATATIIYQAGTIMSHPIQSISWIVAMTIFVSIWLYFIRKLGKTSASSFVLIPTVAVD